VGTSAAQQVDAAAVELAELVQTAISQPPFNSGGRKPLKSVDHVTVVKQCLLGAVEASTKVVLAKPL
jgi:hypothetical protein